MRFALALPSAVLPKRRLPVLQNADGGSDAPPRSAWQWVGFGALAIVAVWVPLSAVAGAVAARLLGTTDSTALPRAALLTSAGYMGALAAGALAGGYLVGKWGPANVGVRHAALSGLAAAAALTLVTLASFGATVGLLLVALLAPPMAALGGRLGVRGRIL